MALPRIVDARRVPGDLVVDPTDLTAAFPHGGTALGSSAGLAFRHRPVDVELRAHERRGQLHNTLEVREEVEMFALMRGLDPDALSKIFPSVVVGASGQAKITYPPPSRPALGDARGVVLLFSPRAPEDHQAIIMYNAIPRAAEDVTWRLSRKEELVVRARFRAIPDASGRVYQIALLSETDP